MKNEFIKTYTATSTADYVDKECLIDDKTLNLRVPIENIEENNDDRYGIYQQEKKDFQMKEVEFNLDC